MDMSRRSALRTIGTGSALGAWSIAARAQEFPYIPRIVEPWWTVAGNPDLGTYTTEKQEPVDFAVWQAADGTWQLWSCIRNTACGGHTRLFHGWEGKHLSDPDWTPKGIVMEADTKLGEAAGGLQAPHVILRDGTYHMFYGNWRGICRALSNDGKTYERVVQSDGTTQLFSEDPPGSEESFGTRDAMVLESKGTFYCYYTARHRDHWEDCGAVYARTATDFDRWSASTIVQFGGPSGRRLWGMECPHVVARHGKFYLFNTQRYRGEPLSQGYCSDDPMAFGIEEDSHHVCELPVAAMEIIHHEGQDYIAALRPELDGIRIARLAWERQ